MPAACSAVRTATTSLASDRTSKLSPRSLTSSAPASRVASRTSSSVTSQGLPPRSWLLLDHDDALAGEEPGDRAGVGHGAAVAGDRGADLHRGPVAVVGEALDEQRDALRAVDLVHDRLVVDAAAVEATAALDRGVDVLVGHRLLLRLLDGVVERRVAGQVGAAHLGRDLDVLDQLGEQLAALGVDDRLLVLRGRPLGVARHTSLFYSASDTRSTNRRCTRGSPPTSGWNDVAISEP